jgi:hypothetical protein
MTGRPVAGVRGRINWLFFSVGAVGAAQGEPRPLRAGGRRRGLFTAGATPFFGVSSAAAGKRRPHTSGLRADNVVPLRGGKVLWPGPAEWAIYRRPRPKKLRRIARTRAIENTGAKAILPAANCE